MTTKKYQLFITGIFFAVDCIKKQLLNYILKIWFISFTKKVKNYII